MESFRTHKPIGRQFWYGFLGKTKEFCTEISTFSFHFSTEIMEKMLSIFSVFHSAVAPTPLATSFRTACLSSPE
jgi:hypothetical protein